MLDDLYRAMEWSDARVWKAVRASARDDARIRELLLHLHVVQQAFFSVWRGGVPFVPQYETLDEVEAFARPYYAAVREFLASRTEEQLDAPLRLPWAEEVAGALGQPLAPSTMRETALQVTHHTAYHRGQVNARVRELGGEPPNADYIVWVWLGKPDAAW